jgi:hypothetical protein
MMVALMPYLDGTHDITSLRSVLAEALRSRSVAAPELEPGTTAPERIDASAQLHLEHTLHRMARHGLLEPEASPDAYADDAHTDDAHA